MGKQFHQHHDALTRDRWIATEFHIDPVIWLWLSRVPALVGAQRAGG
jgi:hypothetical protein